ncbi:P pilus assembly protein, porin PapC [Herbaspirillum sp. CF444]|uniref:fimbria/pilus outer membrane usher protein n=1 Tax=Herbaspirillum sp. CF444 TaxID=1144319 RepID=UPI00027233B9|nr:fimbria/pilus outer membrane usher protein [Herbaspirillum sp. CF444]EJL88738.1 P pilus assembly protein, porin PapC [Herbaspirillum sp. CF444]
MMLRSTICLVWLALSAAACAAESEFDQGFLNGEPAELFRVLERPTFMPGLHRLDLYLNDRYLQRADVSFVAAHEGGEAAPCFSRAMLERMGLDFSRLDSSGQSAGVINDQCVDLGALAGMAISVDFAELRVDLTIPQAMLRRDPRGFVDPSEWSSGADAASLNYNLNLYHASVRGQNSNSQAYLGLDAGTNAAGVFLRHRGSLSVASQRGRHYQNISSYLQRNVASLRSQLLLGDTSTGGELFDSLRMRGIRMYSDERMLPQSQRGYAPQIRGIANSNARVDVRQNGVQLYETTVPPGPFVIDDLYPMGYGGDLEVTITEVGGEVRRMAVPYAAVPQLMRPGQSKYRINAGRILDGQGAWLVEASLHHGISNAWTAYAGTQFSQDYRAAAVGAAVNAPIGALSLDATRSQARVSPRVVDQGSSLRMAWSHLLSNSSTGIYLANHRYSTRRFWSLNDLVAMKSMAQSGLNDDSISRLKSKQSFTLSQPLAEGLGMLSATALSSCYWDGRRDMGYQWNYSNVFRGIGYNVSMSRQRVDGGRADLMLTVGINIPLGIASGMLNMQFTRDALHNARQQVAFSGTSEEDRNFSYGVSAQRMSGDVQSQMDAGGNVAYRSRYADFSSSISASAAYRQASFGVRGGAVLHGGGLTLSKPLSDTYAIVEAKGAAGMKLAGADGIRIDKNGYAIIPYLTPFMKNEIELDPIGASLDIQVDNPVQQVAPLAGAAVKVVFTPKTGHSFLVRLRKQDGQWVPFGTVVEDERGNRQGIVGQGGKILLRSQKKQGRLVAVWDQRPACTTRYNLPSGSDGSAKRPLPQLDLTCTTGTQVDSGEALIKHSAAEPERDPAT